MAYRLGLAFDARPRQGQDRQEPGQGKEGKSAPATRALEALDEVGGKHWVQKLMPASALTLLPEKERPERPQGKEEPKELGAEQVPFHHGVASGRGQATARARSMLKPRATPRGQ